MTDTSDSNWGALPGILTGFILAALFFGVLFAISGVWPPLATVGSTSMEPTIEPGSISFVKEPGKWEADTTAIDTREDTRGGLLFGDNPGDVIIFEANGNGTKVIHRAEFRVEKGENWYGKANRTKIPVHATSCSELEYCPAPYDAIITKGDNNDKYDPYAGVSRPVKQEWVESEAVIAIPLIGFFSFILVSLAVLASFSFIILFIGAGIYDIVRR